MILTKFTENMGDSSVLGDVGEMFQLAEELRQREDGPYTQRLSILKKIAKKLEHHMDRISGPIYLSNSRGKPVGKGVCLSGRSIDTDGSKLKDQELWLLNSGTFLTVRLRNHHYEGSVQWIDDEPKIGSGEYVWVAEAEETENPELLPTADEVKWAIAFAALNWEEYERSILATVKGIREEQSDFLLDLLKEIEDTYKWGTPCPLHQFLLNLSHDSLRLLGRDGVRFLLEAQVSNSDLLARFGEDATELLIQVFTTSLSRNERRRNFLVNTLGKIGGEKAMEHLIKVLQRDYSDTNFVRRGALKWLGVIGDEGVYVPIVKSWSSFYKEEVFQKALEKTRVQLTEKSVDPLIQLLEHGSSYECSLAVEGLGQIGGLRAVEALAQQFEKEKETGIQKNAVDALEKIGSNEAMEALIKVYKRDRDKEIRKMAGWALDRLGKRPRSLFKKLFGRR